MDGGQEGAKEGIFYTALLRHSFQHRLQWPQHDTEDLVPFNKLHRPHHTKPLATFTHTQVSQELQQRLNTVGTVTNPSFCTSV